METLKRYKGTLIGLFLLVGLFFVYTQFIQGTSNDPLLTSNKVAGVDGTQAGQEIIQILREIKKINLDTSIFENESFTSLTDYRTIINPQPVGRENPFEPIGFGVNRLDNLARPLLPDIQLIDIQPPEEQEFMDDEEEVGS